MTVLVTLLIIFGGTIVFILLTILFMKYHYAWKTKTSRHILYEAEEKLHRGLQLVVKESDSMQKEANIIKLKMQNWEKRQK